MCKKQDICFFICKTRNEKMNKKCNILIKIFYLLLTQPLTPKAPTREVEFITVRCKLALKLPLKTGVE